MTKDGKTIYLYIMEMNLCYYVADIPGLEGKFIIPSINTSYTIKMYSLLIKIRKTFWEKVLGEHHSRQ